MGLAKLGDAWRHLGPKSINEESDIFSTILFQAQTKGTPIAFHWSIPTKKCKRHSFCEVVQQIWRLIIIILQLFLMTTNTEEVHIWHD